MSETNLDYKVVTIDNINEDLKPITINKTLKENLPTQLTDTSKDELHFTEDGGIYLSRNNGTIVQVGVDDETKEKINSIDDLSNDVGKINKKLSNINENEIGLMSRKW